jgi:hypothetical protein
MSAENTVMDITVLDYPGEDYPGEAAEGLAPRVGPLAGLRQTFSLSWRTLVQVKHNPGELIDFSVQPVMFLLLFTYVFGGAIGGSPHAYLQFALAGIIVQNSLFTTLNTATGLARSPATRSSPPRPCRAGCRPGPRPTRCRCSPTRCAG